MARGRGERWQQSALVRRLRAADVVNGGTLFAAVLFLCFVPFMLVIRSMVGRSKVAGFSERFGLTGQAAHALEQAFTSSASTAAAVNGLSWVFVILGGIAAAAAIQELYERVFEVEGRGFRHTPQRVIWLAAALVVTLASGWALPWLSSAGGSALVGLWSLVEGTAFLWFSMWLLLGGRLAWRELFPSALATGIGWLGLVIAFRLTISGSITSSYHTYGTIGVVFVIMSVLIGVGVVVVLGALLGLAWRERR
jgi:membrane protein